LPVIKLRKPEKKPVDVSDVILKMRKNWTRKLK
jgi:hypothetical protein